MSKPRRIGRVGVLAVAFGIWAAVLSNPGIVAAEPAAEPSPDSSEVGVGVESPVGGTDSTTESGTVSPGGSTPPAGGGSVGSGSGSGESPGPDSDSVGATDSTLEPASGVVIRSSGGALTSGHLEQPTDEHRSAQAGSGPAGEPTTPYGLAAEPASPVAGTTARRAGPPPTGRIAAPSALMADRPEGSTRRHLIVVPKISAIPESATTHGLVGAEKSSAIGPTSPDATVDVGAETMAVQRNRSAPGGSASNSATLRFVTSFLAAALAPLVVPLPGSPVGQPTQWAVLAWMRRQSERSVLDQRPGLVAHLLQTEKVDACGEVAEGPSGTIDRIDRVTGWVTGSAGVAGERDRLSYELAEQLDRRLGRVTVDRDTGQWTFAPSQSSRLAAQLTADHRAVEFSIAASDGRTIDVRAPVEPAEAAVTASIEVGGGLVYGLAAVGDRLYVLHGAPDDGGNGSVEVIEASTRMVAGSIEVGAAPFAVAASGSTLYVGNAGDGTVSVVDVASSRVVDVIAVGANPFGLEVMGDRLYVADQAGTVSVIDLNDNTELARIPLAGHPFAVAATVDRIYVTNYEGGTVAVLDQATNTVVDAASAGGYPYYAAVMGGRLFVGNAATNALTIVDRSVTTMVQIDPAARSIDAIPSGATPVDFVVRGDRLYVSNVNCGTVSVIDVATNQPVQTIAVGIHPGLLTATADGRTIYVADVMDSTVRVISSVRHLTEV